MSKSLAFVLVLAVVLGCAAASNPVQISIKRLAPAVRVAPPAPTNDLCKLCISFSGDALNELLNIILNTIVIGGCQDLCTALAQKTGSQTLGAVCEILCDIVGIKPFINFIENADLDTIYFCELLDVCAINDHGDATITSFTAIPKSGRQGTTFDLVLTYVSRNGTGTGELDVGIETVDGIPLGQDFLMEASPAGSYNVTISVEAKPDPSCDPTQGPCEEWLPGVYTAQIVLCNGECGSKHPHSQIYGQASANFTIN